MSQQRSVDFNKVFNEKTVRKGIFYFVLLSALAIAGVYFYTNSGQTLTVISELKWPYIIVGLLFTFTDLWLGGWRNHIFIRELKPGISQWACFRANIANIFMGAVTPSQSGGGLAQLYVLHREGVKMVDAVTVGFLNWISTIIFFPLSCIAAYFIIRNQMDSALIMYLVKGGFAAFTTFFIIVMIALFRPVFVGKIIHQLALIIGRLRKKWLEQLDRFGQKTIKTMQDYQNNCRILLLDKPWLMPYSLFMTIVLYFNKYILAYLLILGLGLEADFWVVIAIQAVVYFVLYFAPSPGGSGIAEISIATLMAGIIADEYLTLFTLLFRSFLVFIPAFLGGLLVLKMLKKA